MTPLFLPTLKKWGMALLLSALKVPSGIGETELFHCEINVLSFEVICQSK